MRHERDALLPAEGGHGWYPAGHGRLIFLLFLICALEGADIFLLGATFRALSQDLGVSPSDLGVLAMAQALMITSFGPFWGVLADRGFLSRRWILAVGCCGWGLVTIALGFVTRYSEMVALRALNGAFLGCLQPICQGIVSDVTPPAQRGRVFGLLSSAVFIGMMCTSLGVTPMAALHLGPPSAGIMGWRLAYGAIGLLSLAFAAAVLGYMEEDDAPRVPFAASGELLLVKEAQKFTYYFRYRTFQLLVVQGIFGAIPPQALTFLTMYFQLSGFSDVQAAFIATMGVAGAAVGRALGGAIGDALAVWSPGHGRPLTAQISICVAAPLAWTLVGGWVATPGDAKAFAALSFSVGLFSTWPLPAVNRPILSELVAADSRVSIFAWEWMLEGVSGAVLGAPMVGLLATAWGYKLSAHESLTDVETHPHQAQALGYAVRAVCLLPWVVCFLVFGCLHRTYAPDLAMVELEQKVSAALAKKAGAGGGAGCGDA